MRHDGAARGERDSLFSVSAPRNLRQQNSLVAARSSDRNVQVNRRPSSPPGAGIDYEIAADKANERARRSPLLALPVASVNAPSLWTRVRGSRPPLPPPRRVIVISSAVGESLDNDRMDRFLPHLREDLSLLLSRSIARDYYGATNAHIMNEVSDTFPITGIRSTL